MNEHHTAPLTCTKRTSRCGRASHSRFGQQHRSQRPSWEISQNKRTTTRTNAVSQIKHDGIGQLTAPVAAHSERLIAHETTMIEGAQKSETREGRTCAQRARDTSEWLEKTHGVNQQLKTRQFQQNSVAELQNVRIDRRVSETESCCKFLPIFSARAARHRCGSNNPD